MTNRRARSLVSAATSKATRPARRGGYALVEALVAIALVALAGTVVAAAATTNMRALRAAAVLERLVALASRELSLAEARGAPALVEDVTALDPDLGVVARHLEVSRDADGIATLAVRVTAPGAAALDLRTRMQTTE